MKKIGKDITIGSWVTLAHPGIAEIMANAGFDWLAVDLEHSVITIREAEELIRVISLAGVRPLVRLTSNNVDLIKRVMDAGSDGIIVPNVNSSEDAERCLSATKYPPDGLRGVGLARAQGYGEKFDEYLNWQKNESTVIVQIENIKAVENIESIFQVEGIDGFILGPYDLSASMGIPGEFSHPDFLKTVDHINNMAGKFEMPSGIHIIEPNVEEIEIRIKQNFNIIAYSLDIRMLSSSSIKGVEKFEKFIRGSQ